MEISLRCSPLLALAYRILESVNNGGRSNVLSVRRNLDRTPSVTPQSKDEDDESESTVVEVEGADGIVGSYCRSVTRYARFR